MSRKSKEQSYIEAGLLAGESSRIKRYYGWNSSEIGNVNKWLALATAEKNQIVECRWVRQKEYPLHLMGSSRRGYLYMMNIDGKASYGLIPGDMQPHAIIEFIGPSYIHIKRWMEIPGRLTETNTPLEILYAKANDPRHSLSKLDIQEVDELFNGRKWLVASGG